MVAPLRSFLNTEDLVQRLLSIESRMKDFYRFWQVHAPHYTDHGETHCKTVEKNLDELIPDDIKNEINEYENFLLLSSVYLHDVGIMCSTKTEEENEKIRENHHERSRRFIFENLKDILNGPERDVVGNISLAHRDFIPLSDVVRVKMIRHGTLGNIEVRVQFLAGLLRLADACDLCHTRTARDLVTVSKLSDEAIFHHALHERVSGISFDTKEKTIRLDLNIASDKEKPICQKYLIDRLQRSLGSVKDTLIRNGIVYIDVSPRFTETTTLTTKLVVPVHVKRKKIPLEKEAKIEMKMWRKVLVLQRKREYKKGLILLEKALKENPNDALGWNIRGDIYRDMGDLEEARKSYDKSVELEPDNSSYWNNAGHFYGEWLYNPGKSFQYFQKAYQLHPTNIIDRLNYAEALIAVGKTQEGHNLATKCWRETDQLRFAFNAILIRVYSLFLLGKRDEGFDELRNLLIVFDAFPSIRENNLWVYNKIRKYIADSSLDGKTKAILDATIDLIEGKLSSDEFKKKYGKFAKSF